MSNSVVVKSGRLIIRKNGVLVIDKGGDFIEACTNGNMIVALLSSGRVQELKMDGEFVKDIMGNGAAGIDLSEHTLVITKTDGRQETYVNGRFKLSSGPTPQKGHSDGNIGRSSSSSGKGRPAGKSANLQTEAEKLGAAAADMLMNAAGRLFTLAVKKLREKFASGGR